MHILQFRIKLHRLIFILLYIHFLLHSGFVGGLPEPNILIYLANSFYFNHYFRIYCCLHRFVLLSYYIQFPHWLALKTMEKIKILILYSEGETQLHPARPSAARHFSVARVQKEEIKAEASGFS